MSYNLISCFCPYMDVNKNGFKNLGWELEFKIFNIIKSKYIFEKKNSKVQ